MEIYLNICCLNFIRYILKPNIKYSKASLFLCWIQTLIGFSIGWIKSRRSLPRYILPSFDIYQFLVLQGNWVSHQCFTGTFATFIRRIKALSTKSPFAALITGHHKLVNCNWFAFFAKLKDSNVNWKNCSDLFTDFKSYGNTLGKLLPQFFIHGTSCHGAK